MQDKESSLKVFNALTGYRAVAAYMVFVFHSSIPESLLGKYGISVKSNLNIGVSLFFILSGFLIVYRNMERIEFTLKWFTKYMQNRFSRIYPVLFIYTLFVAFVQKDWALENYFVHLFMISGLADVEVQKILPAWSLTVEENFYFCAPFIIYFFKQDKLLKPFMYSVLSFIVFFFVFSNIPYFDSIMNFNDFRAVYKNTFWGRSIEFFSGAYLGYFLVKKPELAIRTKSFKITAIGILGVCIYLLLVGLFRFIYLDSLTLKVVQHFELFFRTSILPFIVIVLLYGLIREDNFVSRVLGGKIFVLLGKSSYVFYLIHLGPIAGYLFTRLELGFFLGAVALQIIALIIYFCWEKPMNKLLRAKN